MTSADTLLFSLDHHNVWVDAKGRSMLIITPKRHVERVTELTDDELVELAMQLRKFDAKLAIVNHGAFQNHAHLHLKLAFADLAAECPAAEPIMLKCQRLYAAVKHMERVEVE